REVVQKSDGSQQTALYALNGRAVREESIKPDGTKTVTTQEFGRNGNPRVRQAVNFDGRGREISKTVTLNLSIASLKNTTVINDSTERHYARERYGFVYQPPYVATAAALASWYDPYWYGSAGVFIVHPF